MKPSNAATAHCVGQNFIIRESQWVFFIFTVCFIVGNRYCLARVTFVIKKWQEQCDK
jgi:hypothetical protein